MPKFLRVLIVLNHSRQKKILLISIVGVILLIGVACILYSLNENINLYVTPTEAIQAQNNQKLMIGGFVKDKSFHEKGDAKYFIITDGKTNVNVKYTGVMPNLFKENTMVIVKGQFQKNTFMAETVLAKHDERYMPKS